MISLYDLAPNDVMRRYMEPHRVYHSLEHIYTGLAVMQTFPEFQALNDANQREVMRAWWYHDAVYEIGPNVKHGYNEYESARLAQAYGESPVVANLVRGTIYPVTGDAPTTMHAIIQDTDLFGFCSPRFLYDRNDELIKAEFYGVYGDDNPNFDWAGGRRKFLEMMLEKQKPFYKLPSNQHRNALAEANILVDLNG